MKQSLSTTSLLIAAGLLTAASTSAATIFEDTFTGDGALDGRSPTPTASSETWNATGRSTNGGALSIAGTSTSFLFLPSALTAGNLYELSVDMSSVNTGSTNSRFAGFGFFNTITKEDDAFSANTPLTPWMFIRTENTAANEGDMDLRSLGSNSSAIDSNFDVTTTRSYKLVLNTSDTDAGTAGDQFSISLFVDDFEWSTIGYSAGDSTALLTNITSVGVTTSTAGIATTFDNFKLTTVAVPEPSSYALLAGLAILTTAVTRRRR